MDQLGYKNIETLGTGTFGTVYKCQDNTGLDCCIKRIKLNKATKAVAHAHFELIQQEIYLLQNLNHPQIIGLHSYFYTHDHEYICIVMEFAQHGPLSKLLADKVKQNNFLEENEIKKLFVEILLGVEFLHMKNVIHKDIKPDNILICDNGRLKIADFGVSKITNTDDRNMKMMLLNQKVNEMGGTPSYMAPETLTRNHFTFASDIWALGCILYELCMLHPPFSFAESMEELIKYTYNGTFKPINYDNDLYSDELISFCVNMIVADPIERVTMKEIISNPYIVNQYYNGYFDFSY